MDGHEHDLKTESRLTAAEQSLKSLHKRVDHIESLVDSIQQMIVEIQHMREDLNKVSEKVDVLEKKPLKAWGTVATAVLSALGGGLGTLIVSKLVGG